MSEPLPPITIRPSIARVARIARARSRTSRWWNSLQRAEPRIVPPSRRMPGDVARPELDERVVEQAAIAALDAEDSAPAARPTSVAARIAAFMPGASPPLVRIAIRFIMPSDATVGR